jgi:hypothetical protein
MSGQDHQTGPSNLIRLGTGAISDLPLLPCSRGVAARDYLDLDIRCFASIRERSVNCQHTNPNRLVRAEYPTLSWRKYRDMAGLMPLLSGTAKQYVGAVRAGMGTGTEAYVHDARGAYAAGV